MPDIVEVPVWKGFLPFLERLKKRHKDDPDIYNAKVEKVLDIVTDIMIGHIENGERYYFESKSFIVCDRVAEKVNRIFKGKDFKETFKMWPRTAQIFYQMGFQQLIDKELRNLQDDGGD